MDSDRNDCQTLLQELQQCALTYSPKLKVLFRLAIEEIEAWYLGDRAALRSAFPQAKTQVWQNYKQDGVCGTGELLADGICPEKHLRTAQWPLPGQAKCEWAQKMGEHLGIHNNLSPSFNKFCDGLKKLMAR